MSLPQAKQIEVPRKNVWLMFDRIARRYDFLNRVLSMGQDVRWRRLMAHYLPPKNNLFLLDVATGTADVIISLLKKSHRVTRAIGSDMSEQMLELGREKVRRLGLQNTIDLQTADASDLPYDDDFFEVVTISFGIRNVTDVSQALKQMQRVLKPGGRCLILEFSLPSNVFVKNFYLFYFRKILPKIGGMISGDSYAYNYLNKTVETFPFGEDFCTLMRSNGFVNVQQHPLTFGIATIYQGDKD